MKRYLCLIMVLFIALTIKANEEVLKDEEVILNLGQRAVENKKQEVYQIMKEIGEDGISYPNETKKLIARINDVKTVTGMFNTLLKLYGNKIITNDFKPKFYNATGYNNHLTFHRDSGKKLHQLFYDITGKNVEIKTEIVIGVMIFAITLFIVTIILVIAAIRQKGYSIIFCLAAMICFIFGLFCVIS